MVPQYDKEASTLEAVGLWSPVEHSGYSENLHTSRWVAGIMPTTRRYGRDSRHIRVSIILVSMTSYSTRRIIGSEYHPLLGGLGFLT